MKQGKYIQTWAGEAHQWLWGLSRVQEEVPPFCGYSDYSAGREAGNRARGDIRYPHRLKQAAMASLSVGTSVCLTWVYMGVQGCGATPGPGFISAVPSPQTMQCATLDSCSVPTMCSCSSFPGCLKSCCPCLISRCGRVKAQGWVESS